MYHELSDEMFQEFKKHCEKEGIKYDTDADYREAANNLLYRQIIPPKPCSPLEASLVIVESI